MKVQLISHAPNPDGLIIAQARAMEKQGIDSGRPGRLMSFVKELAEQGENSPLSHISFYFGAEGVSRAVLAQMTRHQTASLSAQSQRYSEKTNFEYSIPPSVEQNPEALAVFTEVMETCRAAGEKIYRILLEDGQRAYEGLGGRDFRMLRALERTAMEEAGYLIPSAAHIRLTFAMNALTLLEFFRLRLCVLAPWEMRSLADQMLAAVREAAPGIFEGAGPACMEGGCPHGVLGCGRAIEMRGRYSGAGQSPSDAR